MKRTLFLTLALASCFSTAHAVTYSDLSQNISDSANNVYYDSSEGYFIVNSAVNSTSVDVVVSMAALKELGKSSADAVFVWNTNAANYGVCVQDGMLYGYWDSQKYGNGYSVADLGNAETVTLRLTNGQNANSAYGKGVTISLVTSTAADEGAEPTVSTSTLVTNESLCSSNITSHLGYYVNTSVVNAVTLNTPSSSLGPYTTAYVSSRTDGSSVGRTMFIGDSITHGFDDRSYRWHMFKTLTDNGIENEIVGPRSGHHHYDESKSDFSVSAYGTEEFNNKHLAESSGRTHNLAERESSIVLDDTTYSSGPRYSGNSSLRTGVVYDCNTYVCMMGTNDLLSDNGKGSTGEGYCDDMAKMLGGTVSYDASSAKWTWIKDETNLGTMGTIASDLMNSDSDVYYVLSIPSWTEKNTNHGVDDTARSAVAQYNEMLQEWVNNWNTDNSSSTQGTMKYVNVNRGLVDITAGKLISPNDFFSASDGLHPTDQGSLIIAGNLAQGMGIGGRTAGLMRADAATSGTEWKNLSIGADGKISAGESLTIAENVFTINDGYTVDFKAVFGNGSESAWLSAADASMSIAVGDGVHNGTLRLSEGYIMWGDSVLFCWDNSTLSAEGNLRIAWHNGNTVDNVMAGYYVWLGDMLIGQGLDAASGSFNGITLSANGAEGYITELIYSNKAYAPTTTLTTSVQNAYTDGQAPVIHKAAPMLSGVDFTNASTKNYANNGIVSMDFNGDTTYKHESGTPVWIGLTRDDKNRSFNYQESGKLGTIFGAMVHTANNTTYTGDGNKLLIDVVKNADITGSPHSNIGIGIAGTYGAASADEFHVYINGGVIGSSDTSTAYIVGGSVLGAGNIGKVNIVVNDGYIRDNIYGGSYGDGASLATVGSAAITINGGRIDGDVVARGTHGSIGNTDIVINGGYIGGNISKGTATAKTGAKSTVTVVGNKADIRGNIEADKVTLKDVSKLALYDNGFDNYRGTITAPVVVLDNVQNKILATLSGLESLAAINRTVTELTAGEALALEALELGADTSLGLFRTADDHTVSTATETTLTISGVLTVRGSGATLNANLVMADGSSLNLAGNSLQLGSSLTLGGVQLDDVTIDKVTVLEAGVALTLFTEVDELIIGGESYTEATEVAASTAFANAALAEGYRLVYSGAGTGQVSIMAVPEPTTTTLSLLALAALAARRRRK